MSMTGGWEWPDIKAALEKRGMPLASLARRLSATNSAVSKVKRDRSARVERAIADAIGVPPHEIWPERYPEKKRRRAA